MSAIFQPILVYIVLIFAAVYALWRIYRAWTKPDECTSACTDCPLKQNCTKQPK